MPRGRLSELLDQLHEELDAPGPLDQGARARLESLRDEIRERLEGEDEELVDASLMERLEAAVDGFEAEHPELTLQLQRLVEAFRSLGFR